MAGHDLRRTLQSDGESENQFKKPYQGLKKSWKVVWRLSNREQNVEMCEEFFSGGSHGLKSSLQSDRTSNTTILQTFLNPDNPLSRAGHGLTPSLQSDRKSDN